MSEQVLCFAADKLRPGDSWPLVTDRAALRYYLDEVLAPPNLFYVPRDEAETNESYLQVIPYAVIRCGEWVYCYRRSLKGNEARLHGLMSIGVGGHINPCDGDTYANGFWRELHEEINLTPKDVECEYIVGFLYDDSNAVGRVHFGVVHVVDVCPEVAINIDGLWLKQETCYYAADQFENWSRLILESELLRGN